MTRVKALVLASLMLAICMTVSSFAAKKKHPSTANPQQGTSNSFQSEGCGLVGCYRSGSQKSQKSHNTSQN